MIKHFLRDFILFTILLVLSRSSSDVKFEQDFVHSFLMKSEKLKKTDRFNNAEERWIKKTGYKVSFSSVSGFNRNIASTMFIKKFN
jgi:hypothetical protein